MPRLVSSGLVRLQRFKQGVLDVLVASYGPCVVFEHGSSSPLARGGGCIDHAHLHLLPTDLPFAELTSAEDELPAVEGVEGLHVLQGDDPYLFVEGQDGSAFAGKVGRLPGQHLRRRLATQMGVPDEWDYDVFRHEDRIRAGIETLRERL